MIRLIALFLIITLLITGCNTHQQVTKNDSTTTPQLQVEKNVENVEPQYTSLNDKQLLKHIEDLVYRDTVVSLNNEKYVVESVNSVYISKEYLEEVAFNSQSNIYFGYTLKELEGLFQGNRYIFTLSEKGNTTVQKLNEINDVDTEKMIKNVAIGAGVILVCVTVSLVSGGVAPAISVIFATSAKTASIAALSSAALGGISAGIITGVQTGEFDEAIKAAAIAGSEGFKWGAISGAILGGAGNAFAIKAATKTGLTMNEVALIQRESKYPMELISKFHNYKEYEVFKDAGLKAMMVKGKTSLVQNVNLKYVSELPDGSKVTNLVRMQKGYAPLEHSTGKAYNLHHIGQKEDAPLAMLKESQHQGNTSLLHGFVNETEIDRAAFDVTRKEFWKYLGNDVFAKGGI